MGPNVTAEKKKEGVDGKIPRCPLPKGQEKNEELQENLEESGLYQTTQERRDRRGKEKRKELERSSSSG